MLRKEDNQQERLSTRDKTGYFLAGLIEGEGSLSVSVRLHTETLCKFFVDPQLNIYQHKDRIGLLQLAYKFFGTGYINKKSGSENVLVYTIRSRRSIVEKVIPFLEKYMYEFSERKEQIKWFINITNMLENKKHHTKKGMLEIITYLYSNKKRKFRISKETLVERILRGHTPDSD